MTRKIGSIPEKTKQNILAAATEEFSSYGFANASLRHICAKAGVTTGALYAYFKDKNELFESVIAPATDRILYFLKTHYETELATTSEDALSEEAEDIQATMQILHFYYSNKSLCQIVLQNREHPAVCAFFDGLTECMDRHTHLLFQQMYGNTSEKALPVWDEGTIHWFSHIQIDAILYIISHDLEPAQAEIQLKKMIGFMRAGFIALFQTEVKYPDASIRVFDPRGSRQMNMQACPLGSLLAGITEP